MSVRRCLVGLGLVALSVAGSLVPPSGVPAGAVATEPAAVYGAGDVFLYVADGTKIHEFTPDGSPVRQLEVPDVAPQATVFDQAGDLLVGTFFGPIDELDPQGGYVGVWADTSQDGLPGSPDSMTVDATGHVFVSSFSHDTNTENADVIREYDPDGTLVDHFRVRVRDHEVEAIDLAADQCTLYYRTGTLLLTYDVCARTQGRPITRTLDRGDAGLRLVPDGTGDILATVDDVGAALLSPAGRVLRTYAPNPPGQTYLDLALAADGTSFWTTENTRGYVFRIRISDGRALQRFRVHSRAGGSGDTVIGSLSVYGEPTVARTATPPA